MLASGWAVVDRRVLPTGSSFVAKRYNHAAAQARGARRGIWANPILPPGAEYSPGIPGSTAEDPLGLFEPGTRTLRKRPQE